MSHNRNHQKYAVLTMDVEDWYHTEYLKREGRNDDYTMLDGVDRFAALLADEGVPASFFVLGELLKPLRNRLRELADAGHEIGSHGFGHRRPLTVEPGVFAAEVADCRKALEDHLGAGVRGFRAPCFSLDRERLSAVIDAGFEYDSSRVQFKDHPLYGTLDVSDFEPVSPGIFRKQDFLEFEVSTLPLAGKNVPVAGGGYLRMFPWMFMQTLIRRYLRRDDLYVMYIHPSEISAQANPPYPAGVGRLQKLRFETGRASVERKIRRLIALLRREGFTFTTFADLREEILTNEAAVKPAFAS